MIASSSASLSSTSRMITGTSCRPASCAARQRRSPAISSNRFGSSLGRTSSGCITPFSRIELVSSSSCSGSKSRRGFERLATTKSTGKRLAPLADSATRSLSIVAISPIRAASPRPSREGFSFIGLSSGSIQLPLPPDHFGGQAQIGLAAGTFQVIEQRRLSVGRRLGKAHVPGNDRVVDERPHLVADVLQHLLGKIVAPVEHGHHHALDGEPRVER